MTVGENKHLKTETELGHITSKACFLGHLFRALIAAAAARSDRLAQQEALQTRICMFV